MAKNKVKLAWIVNDAARRAALKKRRRGLMKKVEQLGVLCGVETCAVVFPAPEGGAAADSAAPVTVFPSAEEARRLMARFRELPEVERRRKMVDHETFLRQRRAKLVDQRRRLERGNRQLELRTMMFDGLWGRGIDELSLEDGAALSWLLEIKLKAIYDRRAALFAEQMAMAAAQPPPPPPPPPPPLSLPGERSSYGGTLVAMLRAGSQGVQAVEAPALSASGSCSVTAEPAAAKAEPTWLVEMMSSCPTEESEMYVEGAALSY